MINSGYYTRALEVRALNDLEGTCCIYIYALAVIVVVVGIREIYTNVERESSRQRNCVHWSEFKKRGKETKNYKNEPTDFRRARGFLYSN